MLSAAAAHTTHHCIFCNHTAYFHGSTDICALVPGRVHDHSFHFLCQRVGLSRSIVSRCRQKQKHCIQNWASSMLFSVGHHEKTRRCHAAISISAVSHMASPRQQCMSSASSVLSSVLSSSKARRNHRKLNIIRGRGLRRRSVPIVHHHSPVVASVM